VELSTIVNHDINVPNALCKRASIEPKPHSLENEGASLEVTSEIGVPRGINDLVLIIDAVMPEKRGVNLLWLWFHVLGCLEDNCWERD